mmetsp:Transcript_65888/g.166915  ORF Transcript_65888/g.166915 Transcript_65888/m.166915 type:complete len:252 (+) Transcript_65888:1461-2216(+)
MLRLHEGGSRSDGTPQSHGVQERPRRFRDGLGGLLRCLLQEFVRCDGLPDDVLADIVVEAVVTHKVVEAPGVLRFARIRPREALELKQGPRILFVLENSTAVLWRILVLRKHDDGRLQVLDGLNAVCLLAVELGRLLLAELGGLSQGLLVGDQALLQLLDRGLELGALGGRAFYERPKLCDLGRRGLDCVLLFLPATVAPTSQLLEDSLVLIHVLFQSFRHLGQQVHDACDRRVLAARAIQRFAPCLQAGP